MGRSTELDFTHDPQAVSWIEGATGHDTFPIQNLPLGVFSHGGGPPACGVAIGDYIADLGAMAQEGLLSLPVAAFEPRQPRSLNTYFALPGHERRNIRQQIFMALRAGSPQAQRAKAFHQTFLRPARSCEMQLPAVICDYTDFYAGIHHARNGGVRMGRNPPLPYNYQASPIAYHGRASSIRCSPRSVRRPGGLRRSDDGGDLSHGFTQKLDFELELGAWIGPGNPLGESVPVGAAGEMIVALCLLNDLSARDFQAWEMVPLGPFTSKNFATVVSPWAVTIEALAPFRAPRMPREPSAPPLLPYLDDPVDAMSGSFSIELQVELSTAMMRAQGMAPATISRTRTSHLYWTFAQMIAHHTVGGCDLRPGDLLGSGTISAPERSGYGSLAEITDDGSRPAALPSGERSAYLRDGDQVTFTAFASSAEHARIGFGRNTVEIVGTSEKAVP